MESVVIGVAAVAIIISILQIILALRLFFAAKNRDYRNCRIWIIVTVIVVVINIASLILNSTSGEFDSLSFGITIFLVCYKLFELLVVISFLRTLRGADRNWEWGCMYATSTVPQPGTGPHYPAQHQG
ncbi:hypothetical protein Ocin01_11524 [Orchesella cincta]|uniref:Uncharacterized protein n=1 Tax=Orchesella cincta TaxID=48709 RepID=A0A1D2MQ58_ORCCI|nr:hypothetical protein Ocin01_11524 [Orchesella cincta]